MHDIRTPFLASSVLTLTLTLTSLSLSLALGLLSLFPHALTSPTDVAPLTALRRLSRQSAFGDVYTFSALAISRCLQLTPFLHTKGRRPLSSAVSSSLILMRLH